MVQEALFGITVLQSGVRTVVLTLHSATKAASIRIETAGMYIPSCPVAVTQYDIDIHHWPDIRGICHMHSRIYFLRSVVS